MTIWTDFLSSGSITLKLTLIVIALIAFIAIASACSPVFEAWDKVTGYGI